MRRLLVLLAILILLAPAGLAQAAECGSGECPCCPFEESSDGPQIDEGCCCATEAPSPSTESERADRADGPRGPELPAFDTEVCQSPDCASRPPTCTRVRVEARSRTGPHSVQSLNCAFLC